MCIRDRVNTVQILARNLLEVGQACTRADKYRVVFPEQLVHGLHAADDRIGADLHAQRLDGRDFLPHERLRQTELRDAVYQHAARGMQGFKDRDLIAELGKVACAGQTGWARADHGDLFSVLRDGFRFRQLICVLHAPVRDKALEAAYADWLALDAAYAFAPVSYTHLGRCSAVCW